jgi:hypothetical protein
LGPHQLGNDIDTYFRHLVKDLKVLWYKRGVEVWYEYKRDSPAAHNLSGQSKKVGCVCPHLFLTTF